MVLNRTILALWKARSLSPEQKVQIVEEASEAKSLQSLQTEESGSFLGLDDVSMSEVYSSTLSVPVSYFSLSLSLYLYIHVNFLQRCTQMCGSIGTNLFLSCFCSNVYAVLLEIRILQFPSRDS